MNQTTLLIAIGAVALAAILWPLLRGTAKLSGSATRATREPAGDAPDLPDELAELELDYQMGRLSEADYLQLRERAGLTAASAVPATPPSADEPDSGPVPSRGDLDARAEAMIRAARKGPRVSCPSCGERPESGARFCSSCGTQLATTHRTGST
ncbi:MAG TPA: zinc ribbon domain-containing protein [Gemmatimonadaceae bacterium]